MQIVSIENRVWPFMQIVSNGDNLHERYQILFSGKNKNKKNAKRHYGRVFQKKVNQKGKPRTTPNTRLPALTSIF